MRSLTLKLTLAFLLVSLTGIALVTGLVYFINSTEFNRVVAARGLNDYASAATDYYKANGSWTGVEAALVQKGLLPSPDQQPNNQANGHPNGGHPPLPFALVDQNNNVIISGGPNFQNTTGPTQNEQRVAITVNNQVVGYVVSTGIRPNPNSAETRYLAQTNQASLLAALGAAVIAVLLGLFLARTITRPVRELTLAASAMAKGDLKQQVPVRSKDELGELSKTFNKMSADLEHANELRKQMTADIAHDLRTPLAVITGYLEGLKDGVLKPTPKRFVAMYDEAQYLQRLIEDLRTLSLADAGELSMNYEEIQPGELIEKLASSYQHQAELNSIALKAIVEENLPIIKVDPERMQQALSNLVSNAMRYTPGGGEIVLSACREDSGIRLEVQDNGAGISAEELPHLFERFYRGDINREEGNSGLGLAIARSIVELQGATITAGSDGPGTGSRFTIHFPV